jgi:hypothetical protein
MAQSCHILGKIGLKLPYLDSSSSMLFEFSKATKEFLLSSLTYSQIWLSPLVGLYPLHLPHKIGGEKKTIVPLILNPFIFHFHFFLVIVVFSSDKVWVAYVMMGKATMSPMIKKDFGISWGLSFFPPFFFPLFFQLPEYSFSWTQKEKGKNWIFFNLV